MLRRSLLVSVIVLAILSRVPALAATPVGTLTIGVHVTLVNRWLDPQETEALITPFMVLYPLHDALVKPTPAGLNPPSLAQIQKIVADRVLVAPIFQQAFIWGVGPRVAEPGAGLIQGYAYAAPGEDLKLK
jgi:hypothetical protein